MFKLHNVIEIEGENVKRTAFNNIVNISSPIALNKPYSKYILLSDGKRTHAYEALTDEICTNPLGTMYIVKFVTIKDGDFSFHTAGLSYDGIHFVNMASFETVTLTPGIAVTVSITMYLSCTGQNCLLVGGDNPLVRFLLGDTKRGIFTIARGKSHLPAEITERENGNFFEIKSATVGANNRYIEMDAIFETEVGEAVVLMDDVPVLRCAFLSSYVDTLTASKKVVAAGRLAVGKNVSNVFNLKQGNIDIEAFTLKRTYDYFGSPVKLDVKVSPDSKLISDSSRTYAAAVSGKEAAVFMQKKGRVELIAQKRISGGQVKLLRDGTMMEYFDGKLTISALSGAVMQTAFESFDDWAAVKDYNGQYHLAVRRGRTLTRYAIGETVDVAETIALTGSNPYFLGAYDGYTLAMGGLNNPIKIRTLHGEFAAAQKNFGYIFEDFNPYMCVIDGYLMHMKSNTTQFIASYGDYDGFEFSTSDDVKFNGEIGYAKNWIVLPDYGYPGVKKLTDADFSTAKDFSRLGDYILRILQDGSLDAIPLYGEDITVCSPLLTQGQNVVYNYTGPKKMAGVSGKVAFNLKINF